MFYTSSENDIYNVYLINFSYHLMLFLSFSPGTVVLKGGLRPPLFIMGLLVRDDSCHLMLLLLLCPDTVMILRGGLRPPLFVMGLPVGDYSCHLMLFFS